MPQTGNRGHARLTDNIDWPAEQELSASTSGEAGATTGQTGQQPGQPSASAHLWEESWDDDDASGAGEDFAAALRGEMGK